MLIMYQEDQDEVAEALNILLETIENVIKKLNVYLGQAGKEGKYDQVEDCIGKAKQMTAFKKHVEELKKKWDNIFADVIPQKARSKKRTRQNKLKRGLITPKNQFFVLLILQALVELGGAARRADVIDKVEKLMSKKINNSDDQLPNNRTNWQQQADFARLTMVKKKLLSPKSPKGVWEITDKGRKFLEQNK